MDDAVRRVPKGQREIRRREAPEEGKEQGGERAFASACSAEEKKDKLGLAIHPVQEVIQRRQKSVGQQRPDHFFRRRRVIQKTGENRERIRAAFRRAVIPRQLIRQLNGEFLITRHEEMPGTVNLLPPGHGIYGLPLRGMGGLLDRVADFVFDNRTDFQDAVRAPLVDQPVEGTELTAADFNLWQSCAVLPNASQPQPFGFFGSVIQCDLTEDVR